MDRLQTIRRKCSKTLSLHPRFQFPFSYAASKARIARAVIRSEPVGADFSNFLFIVSCGRSGTTLLRRLLVENYSIYIPPETYVLAGLVRSFIDSGAVRWPDRVAMTLGRFEYHTEFETFGLVNMAEVYRTAINLPASQRSLGSIVKTLFDQLARENGVEHVWLGDKTPVNIFQLGLVQKIFPRARFLHVVRDPADVIESVVRMGQHGDAKDAALRWRRSVVAWKRFQHIMPSALAAEISYEDLVKDTSQTLAKTSTFFGLPARRTIISASESLGDVSVREHHGNVLRSINADSVGKGRACLSSEQCGLAGPIVNSLAKSYGYEPI